MRFIWVFGGCHGTMKRRNLITENVLQTLQHLIQDVIAPDLREVKVRIDGLEKQIAGIEKQNASQYQAIMAAISESRAQADVLALREIGALRERVAILESQRH